MSMNLVTLLYLVASICFIQALKGLSHPTTSIKGNFFGMIGMAIAVATTVGLIMMLAKESLATGLGYVLAGLVIGGGAGAVMAKRVEMTGLWVSEKEAHALILMHHLLSSLDQASLIGPHIAPLTDIIDGILGQS